MIESLVEQIEARHADVQAQMADPDVIADRHRYAEAGRLYNQLAPAAKLAEEWRRAQDDAAGAQELLAEDGEDPELRELLETARARIAELEEEIRLAMVEIDVYRSSGPGGQSVNTTDSAVRITHKPTGIVVSMQDEKSQLQNRERAMKVLRARLYEAKLAEQQAELAAARSAQVGTGERAEKIRTYNFPERRVTDHRIKLTVHNLDQLLAGELDDVTAALQDDEKRRRLDAAAA